MSEAVSDDIRLGHGHDGTVEVSVRDHVATMTIRGGQNRFNATTVGRINKALDQVESNKDVHALVMMGEGRYFSLGLDLPWMKHLGETGKIEDLNAFLKSFRDLVARLLVFPMPTVAVLNGHAAAGGALLALAADVRVMRKDRGFFYINEVRIGLFISGMLRELVVTKIPPGEALTEAVIFGKRLGGNDTLRLGIVSAICEEHELQQTGQKVARQMLADGPLMRKNLKRNKEIMYSNILSGDVGTDSLTKPADFAKALAKAKI